MFSPEWDLALWISTGGGAAALFGLCWHYKGSIRDTVLPRPLTRRRGGRGVPPPLTVPDPSSPTDTVGSQTPYPSPSQHSVRRSSTYFPA